MKNQLNIRRTSYLICALMTFFFLQSAFAGNKITPNDKAQITRNVGESVFVECKKAGPFSKNCQVNCGNGQRFRKPSGYCYYLSQGSFILNVRTRYRNKDIVHTAQITVKDKKAIQTLAKKQAGTSQSVSSTRSLNSTNLTRGHNAQRNAKNSIIQIKRPPINLSADATIQQTVETTTQENALTNAQFSNAIKNNSQDFNGIENENTIGQFDNTNNNFNNNAPNNAGNISENNNNFQNQNSGQFVSNQ